MTKSTRKQSKALTRRLASQAITLALASWSLHVHADACNGAGTITISSAVADNCVLDAGASLDVTSDGSLTPATGAAVSASLVSAGSINNAGTLSSPDNYGIYLSSSTLSGGISNSGTIDSYYTGMELSYNTIGGSVVNSGTINTTSGYGLYLYSNAITGGVTNSGTINASSTGMSLYYNTIGGDVVNSGTINSTSYGLYAYGNNITGGVTNSGTINSNSTGMYLSWNTIGGDVVNSGTINNTDYGLYLYSNTITGGVTNSGTINSSYTGMYLYYNIIGGDVVNSGTINTTSYGIYAAWNDITGGVTNSGTINASSTGMSLYYNTIGGDVVNSGTIDSYYTGMELSYNTIGGSVVNSGTINTTSGYGLYLYSNAITGGVTNSGTINASSTGMSLYYNTIGGDVTNSGTINSYYTGMYLYGNTIGGDVVNSGTINPGSGYFGLYTGGNAITGGITNTGRINGGVYIGENVTVTNDGTISTPEGTTSYIGGDYIQGAGGVLELAASSNLSYGQMTVSGTATLANGTGIHVVVNPTNTLASGNTLPGVLSAGTLNASGLNVTDTSALFSFTGTINGNAIDLDVVRQSSFVSSVNNAGSPAALGAATVLEDLMTNGSTGDMTTVLNEFATLSTEQEVAQGVAQTMPVVVGGGARATLNHLSDVHRVLGAHAGSATGQSAGGALANRSVWVQPYASWGDQDDRKSVTGYETKAYGVILGVEGDSSPQWRVGGAFAYTTNDIESNAPLRNNIDAKNFQFIGYASHALDKDTELRLRGGLGITKNDSERHMTIGGLDRTATASYDSQQLNLAVEAVRSYAKSPTLTLKPMVRAEYIYVKDDSYSESGAGALNLDVGSSKEDSLVLEAGGTLSNRLSDSTTFNARLGLGYDALAEKASVTSTFEGGGASFTTEGIDPSPVYLRGGVGVDMTQAKNMKITMSYDFEKRSDYLNNAASIKLKWPF